MEIDRPFLPLDELCITTTPPQDRQTDRQTQVHQSPTTVRLGKLQYGQQPSDVQDEVKQIYELHRTLPVYRVNGVGDLTLHHVLTFET